MQDEVDDLEEEIKDMLDWKYYTFALQKHSELEDQTSEKSINLKKKILNGILEETKKAVEKKLKRIKEYIKDKNFYGLQVELPSIANHVEYLKRLIKGIDEDYKIVRDFKRDLQPWKDIVEDFDKFAAKIQNDLGEIWKKNRNLIQETKKKLEKNRDKRRRKRKQEKLLGRGTNVKLLLDTHRGLREENSVEYIPFLGVTTIRLRLVVEGKIPELIIKPMFTPDIFSPNVEWSQYICGLNNENSTFDLRKGFIAAYGGGEKPGFIVRNPPPESYVFFFLRHHEKELADLQEHSRELHARWTTEKEAITNLQNAKEQIEQTRVEIERAERNSDLEKAARLRYGTLRELENKLVELETRIKTIQAEDALLKEEVDAEEIAHIVSRWTGIPVAKLLEGEMEKLVHMEMLTKL